MEGEMGQNGKADGEEGRRGVMEEGRVWVRKERKKKSEGKEERR